MPQDRELRLFDGDLYGTLLPDRDLRNKGSDTKKSATATHAAQSPPFLEEGLSESFLESLSFLKPRTTHLYQGPSIHLSLLNSDSSLGIRHTNLLFRNIIVFLQ